MRPSIAPLLAPLALSAAVAAPPAPAAESYDACSFVITSLPATLTTQGVWCLQGDLSTSVASGAAIVVGTNNVTIDCNHFKLGGLAAGPTTSTTGIAVNARVNTTVRNCNVRGFRYGVFADGAAGTLVEDNLFEGNTQSAINSDGDSTGTVVRRNRIVDTGGGPSSQVVGVAVYNDAHVIDNVIAGVAGDGVSNTMTRGVFVGYGTGTVTGNRISGVVPDGESLGYGIATLFADGVVIDRNYVHGGSAPSANGIVCDENAAVVHDNIVVKTANPFQGCLLSGNTTDAP